MNQTGTENDNNSDGLYATTSRPNKKLSQDQIKEKCEDLKPQVRSILATMLQGDNISGQDHAGSSILIENLTGTHGKEVSEDAKSQLIKFLVPIQYIFLAVATIIMIPVFYYLMQYLINVKSMLTATLASAGYMSLLYYIKSKENMHIKIYFQTSLKLIIYFIVFKYLFYIATIESLPVILILAVSYAVYETVVQYIIVKLKPCAFITEIGLLILIIIKYINGSINNMTIYATCIICLVVIVAKLTLDMRSAKNSYEQNIEI